MGGGAEREGERESQAESLLSVEHELGLNPTTHELMTIAEITSWTLNRLRFLDAKFLLDKPQKADIEFDTKTQRNLSAFIGNE